MANSSTRFCEMNVPSAPESTKALTWTSFSCIRIYVGIRMDLLSKLGTSTRCSFMDGEICVRVSLPIENPLFHCSLMTCFLRGCQIVH